MNATRLALLLLACAAALSAQVIDTTVCDVLANPASFDGKVVRIRTGMVVAGFDEFAIDGSGCTPGGAIWLAYPEGTKGKAGPAAFLRLQPAKNAGAVADAPNRPAVTLERNDAFTRFDSLLAARHKSAQCLGCPRNRVTATLTGRLDGVDAAGIVRDGAGAVTAVRGFGNLSLYRARLVLQSVSDVVPHEIDYSATAPPTPGDLRRMPSPASADQLRRAAAAFGGPGEDNGVVVSFGVMNEVPSDDGARSTDDSPDGILYRATFDMDRIGKPMLTAAMAHVGTHIADLRAGTAKAVDDAEKRAWQATGSE